MQLRGGPARKRWLRTKLIFRGMRPQLAVDDEGKYPCRGQAGFDGLSSVRVVKDVAPVSCASITWPPQWA